MSEQKVFISYSHQDADWVHQFAKKLDELNVIVWLDDWQIHPGSLISDAIEDGLRQSDAIVTVITPQNVQSPSVFFELGIALGMGKRLIPIVSPEVNQLPFDFRARRYLVQTSPEDTARAVAAAVGNGENHEDSDNAS